MNLGSSMRRRRPAEGTGRAKNPSKKGRLEGLGGRGRLAVLAAAALLVGSGGGYLYATHMVFPAPEEGTAAFLPVPDLRGMTVEEAGSLLGDRGLEVGPVDSIHHPEAVRGSVLGQSPFPGQLGAEGAPVELTVSLGPEVRPVPDVARLRWDRAATVLRTTGFQVEVDSTESDVPEGRVVGTDPEAGTEVTIPAEIRLTVSLGPPLVTLPDLVGLQEDRAREVLDSLGLEVIEVEDRFRFGFSPGQVLEHHPGAEEEVPAGSGVRIVIGRRGPLR